MHMERDVCPKCGRFTQAVRDLKGPHGFCGNCQWFSKATSDQHNDMLIKLTATMEMLDALIDSAEQDEAKKLPWRKRTREIADSIGRFLKSE